MQGSHCRGGESLREREALKVNKNGVMEFIARLLLVVALVCGVTALVTATNHIENGAPAKWHKLSLGLMVCFWMAGQWLYIRTRNAKLLRQFFLVDIISTVAFGMLAVIGRPNFQAAGHEEFMLSFLMLCLGGADSLCEYPCSPERNFCNSTGSLYTGRKEYMHSQ